MASILEQCMAEFGIEEEMKKEISDSIIELASNVNISEDDINRLIDSLVTADRVPEDSVKDAIPANTAYHSLSSDSGTVVSTTGTAVPADNKQQEQLADSIVALPSATEDSDNAIQQHPVEASPIALPGTKDVEDGSVQQHSNEAAAVVPPGAKDVGDDVMQQHSIKVQPTDVCEAKGIASYPQVLAITIFESLNQKLLVSEIYDSIINNWDRFSLNKATWKNNVRHTLTKYPCFRQCEPGTRGKANYWSIHPACVSMLKQGNFSRRDARRHVELMEKEERERHEREINISQDTADAIMQHQQFNNASSAVTGSSYSSSSLLSNNASFNQRQHPYQHQYQQQRQYRKQCQLPNQGWQPSYQQSQRPYHLSQQSQMDQQHQQQQRFQQCQFPQQFDVQELPQHQQYNQQNPSLQAPQQFQHPQQQNYQLQQLQYQRQHQQNQPQHPRQQFQQMEQSRQFQQFSMRSQPENIMASTTGYDSNLSLAMNNNSADSPAPSQSASNTANTFQHQHYYGQ